MRAAGTQSREESCALRWWRAWNLFVQTGIRSDIFDTFCAKLKGRSETSPAKSAGGDEGCLSGPGKTVLAHPSSVVMKARAEELLFQRR
jgi:hypothetical protein